MTVYAAAEVFSEAEVALVSRVSELVARCPYEIDGDLVRCHELVRAVGEVLGLSWADGWYGMLEHSWLWTKPWMPLKQMPNVIDCYRPGCMPACQLISASSPTLPWDYRRGDFRKDIRFGVITQLVCAMRSAA